MKGLFVKIEEKAWKDEVRSSLDSLAVKLGKPVYDTQAFPLVGKVLWAVVTALGFGFFIGLAF